MFFRFARGLQSLPFPPHLTSVGPGLPQPLYPKGKGLSVDEEYKELLREAKEELGKPIRAEAGKGLPVREMTQEGDPPEGEINQRA